MAYMDPMGNLKLGQSLQFHKLMCDSVWNRQVGSSKPSLARVHGDETNIVGWV